MRIDLHCHTKRAKQGDGAGREVDPGTFAQTMADAEVGIAGIANHNTFDREQYLAFCKAADGVCQVWPGIEFDMAGSNQWHLIVTCNPKEVDAFHDVVDALIGDVRPDDVLLSVEQVVNAVDDLDVLYIPHSHGKQSGKKPRSIPKDSRKLLESMVRRPDRIIDEPTHHSLGVLSRNGYRVILGSDVKDWSTYDGTKLLDLRFPVASFEAFARLVEGNVDEYNSCVLNEGAPITVRVTPVEGAKERAINLFKGVTIIFGQKGSGKTKLIEAISRGLSQAGQEAAFYRSADYRSLYEQELVPDWESCKAHVVGADCCENEFKDIADWSESPVISLQTTYIHYHRSKITNRNRLRLKVADITTLPLFMRENELEKAKSDRDHINAAIAELEQVDIEGHLEAEKAATLTALLGELSLEASKAAEALVVEKYAIALCRFSINDIKRHAERLCDSPSAPSSAGFLDFATNRIKLHKSCSAILKNINGQDNVSSEVFGVLTDKGTILMVTRYLMIGERSNPTDYFNGKKTQLESTRKAIKKLQQEAFGSKAVSVCESLARTMRDKGISSADAFVGAKKYTVLKKTRAPYVPSDGELAIIMLSRFLAEDHDFYLLDEPERGMGNSYVDGEIRTKLLGLAARGKTVVVATHNANIAVRTSPVQALLAEYHGANDFAVYVGSPFSNLMVSCDNPADKRTWSKESMEILEGGEVAFYDRRDMYELS